MCRAIIVGLAGLALSGLPALAARPSAGTFVASQACAAYDRAEDKRNTGKIKLQIGTNYPVVATTPPPSTYVQVHLAGARHPLRWVPSYRGTLTPSVAPEPPPIVVSSAPSPHPTATDQAYRLSILWNPAYCNRHRDRAECQRPALQHHPADRFVLGGLRPQPATNVYCAVPADVQQRDAAQGWHALPEPPLRASTRAELERVLPGVASHLHRHLWIKHGTCYGGDADTYFNTAIALVIQLNGSSFRKFFADQSGKRVDGGDILHAFTAAFGIGTGDAIRITCEDEHIIAIEIQLRGAISPDSQLVTALDRGARLGINCPRGLIDDVGHANPSGRSRETDRGRHGRN